MTANFRKSGIDVLTRVPWGTHFCLFYETKQDLLDTLVPFFDAGLESNELCVWAISEPLTMDDAAGALSQAIPAFARYRAERRIEIIPGREWYLAGDQFDMQRIAGGLLGKLDAALAKGHEGLRISSNAFWLQTEYRNDFLRYERELDRVLDGRPVVALCTYPLATSGAADLLEVADAHQLTEVRRRGESEIIKTVGPSAKAGSLTQRQREVLAWTARGKFAREIGEILQITKRTVDEHVQIAVRKLGAVNRTHAVAIALRERLIEL